MYAEHVLSRKSYFERVTVCGPCSLTASLPTLHPTLTGQKGDQASLHLRVPASTQGDPLDRLAAPKVWCSKQSFSFLFFASNPAHSSNALVSDSCRVFFSFLFGLSLFAPCPLVALPCASLSLSPACSAGCSCCSESSVCHRPESLQLLHSPQPAHCRGEERERERTSDHHEMHARSLYQINTSLHLSPFQHILCLMLHGSSYI